VGYPPSLILGTVRIGLLLSVDVRRVLSSNYNGFPSSAFIKPNLDYPAVFRDRSCEGFVPSAQFTPYIRLGRNDSRPPSRWAFVIVSGYKDGDFRIFDFARISVNQVFVARQQDTILQATVVLPSKTGQPT